MQYKAHYPALFLAISLCGCMTHDTSGADAHDDLSWENDALEPATLE